MSVPVIEQETNVTFMRDSEYAEVYTSDTTVMTRLDKLVEREDCPDWSLKQNIYDQFGNLCGKIYITKKNLVSFRSVKTTREINDEQRQELRERMEAWRARKKLESETMEDASDLEGEYDE